MNFALETLRKFLTKTFEIRPGETKRVLLLQANIFLLITVILILKPIVNALFLDRFGVESLPRVFVLVAVFAAILSSIYSKALIKSSLISIIKKTYIISVISLILFGFLLVFNLLGSWALYLFYTGVALFAVLSASQFWILVNVVLNVREAKRLFGFIGAGAIGGGIFGGYLTSIAAPIVGSEYLVFLCALILLICIPITHTLWKKYVTPNLTVLRQHKRAKNISEHPFHVIRKSRHLALIAGILGVSVIVSKLVDFQFSALASSTFSNPDELAAFFGFWFSTMNILSLLIQLFLTKKVVGKYGVGFSLFILPIGILIPTLLLIFIPHLWVAVFLRVNEGSLKQSVNKAGIELLGLPIPLEIKNQTKTFIDVFVDSLATGVGGLILIVFVSLFNVPTSFISIITFVLVGVWFYMALQVRKEYLRSFQIKVTKVKWKKEKPQIDLSQESVLGGLKKVLEQGSDEEILFILNKIKEINSSVFLQPLRDLLKNKNSQIRAEALSRLYFYKDNSILDEIKFMTKDPDDEVRVAAFEYLIEHLPSSFDELINQYFEDENQEVRGAALVSLAMETMDNTTLKEKFGLKERILIELNKGQDLLQNEQATIHLLRAISYAGYAELYPFIKEGIANTRKPIAIASIQAAGNTLSKYFLLTLIDQLNDKEFQSEALKSLSNYGKGIIDALFEMLNDKDKINEYRNIALVLEKIHSQQSIDLLFKFVSQGDISTRSLALKCLSKMKMNFPHLNFYKKEIINLILNEAKNYFDTLSVLYAQNIRKKTENKSQKMIGDARGSLIELLERRLDGNLERIFYLLGLKYSPDDMLSIYAGIQSKKPDLYINAIEFLDNLLDSNLKKVLMPLVETALLETISTDAIEHLNIKIPGQTDCFRLILEGNDQRLKLAVLHLIKVLKEEKYIELAMLYVNDDNIKIKTFARQAAGLPN